MLSKDQLIDASKCDDLKTIHDCVGCKMYKEDDCVVDVANTALEYRHIIEKLEWSVIADFGNNLRCPMCKELKTVGHKESCKLYLALK